MEAVDVGALRRESETVLQRVHEVILEEEGREEEEQESQGRGSRENVDGEIEGTREGEEEEERSQVEGEGDPGIREVQEAGERRGEEEEDGDSELNYNEERISDFV